MDRHPKVVERLGDRWGAAVADRRRQLGLSQAQLAKACGDHGVTQQTISKIENGEIIPLDRLKVDLARALGTKPNVLFAWPAMKDLVGEAVA